VEYFTALGCKAYLPRTLRLLPQWYPSLAQTWAESIRELLERDILEEHNRVVKRYSKRMNDLKIKTPKGDWLATAMNTFLPRVENLAIHPEGRLSAIYVIIYLVEYAYTDVVKVYTSGREVYHHGTSTSRQMIG
jgi:hypothetical protein